MSIVEQKTEKMLITKGIKEKRNECRDNVQTL